MNDRKKFRIAMYDLHGGATTNFPPGSEGFRLEKNFATMVTSVRTIGFGRMKQIIDQIWRHQELTTGKKSCAPEPEPDYAGSGLLKPSVLKMDYLDFQCFCLNNRHRLSPEEQAWLNEWESWDLACSPMDDNERKLIRYGHRLGYNPAPGAAPAPARPEEKQP